MLSHQINVEMLDIILQVKLQVSDTKYVILIYSPLE